VFCECTGTEKLACIPIRIAVCYVVDNHRTAAPLPTGAEIFPYHYAQSHSGATQPPAGSQAFFLGIKSASA